MKFIKNHQNNFESFKNRRVGALSMIFLNENPSFIEINIQYHRKYCKRQLKRCKALINNFALPDQRLLFRR